MANQRMLSISDILTSDQCDHVEMLIAQIRGRTTPVETLKTYLETLRDSLLAQEVDSGYLYYALCYWYRLN